MYILSLGTRSFLLALLISCLVCVSSLFAQQAAPPTQFSVQESVAYALANNTNLKNRALAKELDYQEIRNIIAVGLPTLRASANYDYNAAVRSTLLPDFISPWSMIS